MDFIKNGIKNLESIGFGAAVPGLRDSLKNVVSNVTSSDADQKAKIQAVIDADRLKQQELSAQTAPQGRTMRRQASAAADQGEGYKGYKKGGKVSSASKRGDGCAQRGKTKGRMI
jgi:hypothetical protein